VPGSLTNDDSFTIEALAIDKDAQPKSFSLAVKPPTTTQDQVAVAAAESKPTLSPQLQYVHNAIEGALRRAIQDLRNRRKVKEYSDKLKIDFISQPRPGKGLCVLDLDYCILDTGLWKEENFVSLHLLDRAPHSTPLELTVGGCAILRRPSISCDPTSKSSSARSRLSMT